MRLVHVSIPDEQRGPVVRVLSDNDVTYVVLNDDGESLLLEFPIPADASGELLDALHDAGLRDDAYTVVGTVDTATTPTIETLMDRYAGTYDPLPMPELRSKARDLSRDPLSYVGLVFLAAVIAAAGLLVESPAVVVGSMVIAPFVGPVLTASVGIVSGDTEMLRESVRLQVGGLLVAILGAALFAALVRTLYFVPPSLTIGALDLVSSRAAPSFLTIAVGVAAGIAAAFGMTTKGPTSLIGVMIAAALVPAAAVVGLALVWERPVVAAGSLVVVTATFLAINVAVYATLRVLGYRRSSVGEEAETEVTANISWPPSLSGNRRHSAVTVAIALVVVAATVGAAYGTYQQATFERETNRAVETALSQPVYTDLSLVSVRAGYAGPSFGQRSTSVTVVVESPRDGSYPGFARAIRSRIVSQTGRKPVVRVQFVGVQRAGGK